MGQHVHEWVKVAPLPSRQGFYRWQCKCGMGRFGGSRKGGRLAHLLRPHLSICHAKMTIQGDTIDKKKNFFFFFCGRAQERL